MQFLKNIWSSSWLNPDVESTDKEGLVVIIRTSSKKHEEVQRFKLCTVDFGNPTSNTEVSSEKLRSDSGTKMVKSSREKDHSL
jgi:hypothetical protein